MARVRHPNVVKLLGCGKSGRFDYLALEWVAGPSVRRVIAEARSLGKPTDFAAAFAWFEQVCKGLAAIHAVGLVHRDIKPGNILIGQDGAAKIADFGIARQVDAGRTACTTTGAAPGTFEYMAPEQLGAPEAVDSRADLYALGVTFYELLTGDRPVGAWRPASELNPTVPAAFDVILGRLLAPIPGHRYTRARDILPPIEGRTPPWSAAGPLGGPGGAGRGPRSGWWTRRPLAFKGALVGASAGAIAATYLGGYSLVGALVGCLPGALGAHLGMPRGSERDRVTTRR